MADIADDELAVDKASISVDDILDGIHVIGDLTEAAAILAESESVLAVIEPFNALVTPIVMIYHVLKDMDANVSAAGRMGYSYGLMYRALDMGQPTHDFHGPDSLDPEATIQRKTTAFNEGAAEAAESLTTAVRNRVLLRIAYNSNDAKRTINEIWRVLCEKDDDDWYGSKFGLAWPDIGLEAKL